MDKITKLSDDLKKIQQNFDTWKFSGLNPEVLVIYLHHKTGISIKNVKSLINSQEEFFTNLIVKEVEKEL